MRRLMLLIAAGSLWLFLAAVPALADGGPHVSTVNSGTSSLTADSCAGCHRAHSAQGEFLLAAASEEALCLSCHGALGTGATTNVEDGVQYVPTGAGDRSGTLLGALRDGGFLNARIGADNPSRMSYPRNAVDVSARPKVPVGASEAVKSAHLDLTPSAGDGIADTGRAWGGGASGLGAAPVTLTCVECHNPHGNGVYRILKPVPGSDADPLGAQVATAVKATYALSSNIVTATQHGLVVSDSITLTNVGGLSGTYYVKAVVNGFTLTVSSTIGGAAVAVTNTTATGSILRGSVSVADSPVDPDANGSNPTKNYTVLQVKGSQGVDATYLLYARDVVAARSGTGIDQPSAAVNITSAGVIGTSTTVYLKTSGAHGLSVGDRVTLTGGPWGSVVAGAYTVGSVSSTGALYDAFTVVGTTATAAAVTGTATRWGISGDYSATGGDYFRRVIPWNPALVNPSCSNTVYSTTNSQYCGTANDAPNGRPNTITSGPTALIGQKAFLDEMSTWCASCHTRYYSASNENTGALEGTSTLSDIAVTTNASDRIVPATVDGSQLGSPSFGDRVTFSGMANATLNTGEWYVVLTGSASGSNWFQVSATQAGSAFAVGASGAGGSYTRVYQSSASSWGFPRSVNGVEDPTYKYQHSTASNRACTVCHVGHGSNAAMTGTGGTTFSLNYKYPDGTTTSTSSRLLKVDNRGTCQMCHDPTGTVPVGTLLGGNTSVP